MKLNKTLRITTICTVCAALIAVIFFYLPFISVVDVTFHGMIITEDGTVLRQTTIELDGSVHNYLFKEDTVQLAFRTDDADWRHCAKPATPYPSADPYIDVPYISTLTYVISGDDSVRCCYAVSLVEGYFIAGYLDTPGKFLVGSTQENTEPETILAYFSQWIDFYFPKQ